MRAFRKHKIESSFASLRVTLGEQERTCIVFRQQFPAILHVALTRKSCPSSPHYPHQPMGCHSKRPSDAPAITTIATADDDVPVHHYRSYARRIRRMLYLGGVLQDQARPVLQSYVMGLLVIVMCFSQVVFVINFCRDYSDNLVVLSKCLGLASSFITPFLMVFQVECALCTRRRRDSLDWKSHSRLEKFAEPSEWLLKNPATEFVCPSKKLLKGIIARDLA